MREVLEELKYIITTIMKPLTEEVKKSMDTITGKYRESIESINSGYRKFLEKYGELKAEAGRLEEELRLARIIQALIKYLSEAKNLPIDYALSLLDGVIKYCRVNNINPKVEAGETIAKKHIIFTTELELLGLLEWARRGLTLALEEKSKS